MLSRNALRSLVIMLPMASILLVGCSDTTTPAELDIDDEVALHQSRIGKHVLVQVDRFGIPAVNTVFIPSDLKDRFNQTAPADDVAEFRSVIEQTIINGFGGDPALAATIASVITPDIQPINTSQPSGFLNGRRLEDDVITAELMLLFGDNAALNDDNVDANDKSFMDHFPFLARPHGGEGW